MNLLPRDIVNIIDDYAKEFETVQIITYATNKIINRIQDRCGNTHEVAMYTVRQTIKDVYTELTRILNTDKRNDRKRIQTRIRPVTYKKHVLFYYRDWTSNRRMAALATAIEFLCNEVQFKPGNELYKACSQKFGEPVPSQNSQMYAIYGPVFLIPYKRSSRIDQRDLQFYIRDVDPIQ